jgi:hypothetical protein
MLSSLSATPGITAPVGSVTVPEILPPVEARDGKAASRQHTIVKHKRFFRARPEKEGVGDDTFCIFVLLRGDKLSSWTSLVRYPE